MPSIQKAAFFSVLLLAAGLSACGENPPAPAPPPRPAAVAPAPAVSAPVPDPRPVDVYALQLGAFRKRANADRLFDRLEKKGLKPYMVSTEEQRPWFKVRVGPFTTQEQAEARSTRLREEHGLKPVVLRQAGELASAAAQDASPGGGAEFTAYAAGGGAGEEADAVVARFLVWIEAWQGIDIDGYLAFYSRDFAPPGGQTREDWSKARRRALSRVRRVKVEVGEVRIRREGEAVEMKFMQNFWSDLQADVSEKTLVWKKEDGEWKIVRETAQPA